MKYPPFNLVVHLCLQSITTGIITYLIVIKFDQQLGASHVDLIRDQLCFFLFFNLPVVIKMKSSNTKKLHIYTAKSLFILRASAARYHKYVEKVGPWRS